MNFCLTLCVLVVSCLTSSDGHHSEHCETRVFDLLARIQCLDEELKTCQAQVICMVNYVHCGDLPGFEGGTLTASSHAVGSVADVQCSDALYQYLGQDVTCMDSGEWSTADRNCDQIEFHDFDWDFGTRVQLPVNVRDGWSFELTTTVTDYFRIFFQSLEIKSAGVYNAHRLVLNFPPGLFVKDIEFNLQVTFNTASIKFTVDGTDVGEITPPFDINTIDNIANIASVMKVRRMRYNY